MREDLKQYMTNLLYSAYDKGENPFIGTTEFDGWVEEQINLIDEYFNNEKINTDNR